MKTPESGDKVPERLAVGAARSHDPTLDIGILHLEQTLEAIKLQRGHPRHAGFREPPEKPVHFPCAAMARPVDGAAAPAIEAVAYRHFDSQSGITREEL